MKEKIPSRRIVLRAALAAGCGLWLPVALAAEESKKVSQASVNYQAKPKGDQKCASCANFVAASNTCKVVEGTVSPEGWCRVWVMKA